MSFWPRKVIFITGGGAGIGRAVALHVARQGASVVIADADGAAANETASLIGAERSLAVRMDVTSEPDIAAAVAQAVSRFGRIDVLHNNASILRRHERIEDISTDAFRSVIEVNAIGMFQVARAVVPVMKNGKGGVIVNMSSKGGARGQSHILAYSVTKAGVLAFSRGLAEQLKPFNIRVNALIPGLVETNMTRGGTNMNRASQTGAYVFKPEEMALAVAYVAEREDLTGAVLEYISGSQGRELRLLRDFEFRKLDVSFDTSAAPGPHND